MTNVDHFAWISLKRQKEVKIYCQEYCEGNRQELMSRSQRLWTSLYWYSTSVKTRCFFAFTSAFDLKQPSHSSLIISYYYLSPSSLLANYVLGVRSGIYESWIGTFQPLDYLTLRVFVTKTFYFRTYQSYGHFPYKIVVQVMRSILCNLPMPEQWRTIPHTY